MPRSRSRGLVSMIRAPTCWWAWKTWPCFSSASTRVVLPWSTWAMMARLRMALFWQSFNSVQFRGGGRAIAQALVRKSTVLAHSNRKRTPKALSPLARRANIGGKTGQYWPARHALHEYRDHVGGPRPLPPPGEGPVADTNGGRRP